MSKRFLSCSTKGIETSIVFQEKSDVGFFGGEGLFIAALKRPGV